MNTVPEVSESLFEASQCHPAMNSITPLKENENRDHGLEPLTLLYRVSILAITKKQDVE